MEIFIKDTAREQDVYEVANYLRRQLEQLENVTVTGEGDGYSNGVFADLSIKLANGNSLYINIEESGEDEFEDEE